MNALTRQRLVTVAVIGGFLIGGVALIQEWPRHRDTSVPLQHRQRLFEMTTIHIIFRKMILRRIDGARTLLESKEPTIDTIDVILPFRFIILPLRSPYANCNSKVMVCLGPDGLITEFCMVDGPSSGISIDIRMGIPWYYDLTDDVVIMAKLEMKVVAPHRVSSPSTVKPRPLQSSE